MCLSKHPKEQILLYTRNKRGSINSTHLKNKNKTSMSDAFVCISQCVSIDTHAKLLTVVISGELGWEGNFHILPLHFSII